MKAIGLVGGVESGKSLVAKMLAELGAVILDADLSHSSLIDLRTLDPHRATLIDVTHHMRSQDESLEINIREPFDMLIHVPRITRWTSSTNASLPDERIASA